MKSKIDTLLWYLKNPRYYSQLFFLVLRRYILKKDDYKSNEAKSWCQLKSSTINTTLNRLFNKEHIKIINPGRHFQKEFDEANSKFSNIPVTMGGAADLILLYNVSIYSKAKFILETGVAYGWSSLVFLIAIKNINGGRLYSTDMPYAKKNNEDYVGYIVPNSLRKNWTLIKKPDINAIPEIIKREKEFDLIHYDSDKSYAGRKWAYPILWKALKKGGIFISDDIQDNIAFKEFSELVGIEPFIAQGTDKYIGVLIKN